jgi:FkbM family methyltransferase
VTSEHQRIREFHRRLLELNGGAWFNFEPHLLAFYNAVLRPGSVAVDGGANVGLHTLTMAQAVLPDGLVIAVEPVPEMFRQLEARLHEFDIPENLTRLAPYGLSSNVGAADFYQVTDPVQHALSGLRNRSFIKPEQVRQIRVELTTLDTLCQDLHRLDFIKLDLEGAELDALRGGRSTLERFRPVVTLEQDQHSPQYFDYTWQDLLDYFTSLRYEIYDLFGLRYSEAAMLDQCLVWDFVALPMEYLDKICLFAAVRNSMQASGVRFESAMPAGKPPLGLSRELVRSELASACIFDYIGSVVNPWAVESIHVSGDAPLQFMGWAVDEPNRSAAGGVDVVIDDAPYSAVYNGSRPDVADHFKTMACLNSGFRLVLAPGILAQGQHVVSLRMIAHDRKSYYQGPALTFTID